MYHIKTREEFIKRANERHNHKFDYSKVKFEKRGLGKSYNEKQTRKLAEYNGKQKIVIICPIHGEFIQTARKHIEKKPSGCPRFAAEQTGKKLKERAKAKPIGPNKVCTKCNTEYPRTLEFFASDTSKRDGLYSSCKKCHKKYADAYRTKSENKKKHANYVRNRKSRDPVYKMRKRISSTVSKALRRSGGNKVKSGTFQNLPYTPKELCEHLEKHFDDKMSWDNYGTYWHLDRIYPQSLLPYDNLEHPNFLKCWALENLQPLEAGENLRKSNKIANAGLKTI